MPGRLSHPMALPAALPADTILQAHPAAVIGRQHLPAADTPIIAVSRLRAAAAATHIAVRRLRAAAAAIHTAACRLRAAAAMATGRQHLPAAVIGLQAAHPAAGTNIEGSTPNRVDRLSRIS